MRLGIRSAKVVKTRLSDTDTLAIVSWQHLMDADSTINLPNDVLACHAMIQVQGCRIEALVAEQERLIKLMNRLVNGTRIEKRIQSSPSQAPLTFETEEECEAAKKEAEVEAKQIIE